MFSLFDSATPVRTSGDSWEASGAALPGMATLKRLIWLYFWLLIFEGALRKWLLPGFSNPLLLIRDPVVIGIYITALMAGVFPTNGFVRFTAALGTLSFLVSEAFGSGNLLVSLYGFRTAFLHLPLIFVLEKVFDRKEFLNLARWHLIVAIPMLFLVMLQFRSSPEAWINNGAGGGVGSQLTVGFGKIRPPGTFSFTTPLVSFVCAAAAVADGAQMRKDLFHPRLAISSLIAIAGMVLVSGSRGALGGVVCIMLGVGFICLHKPSLAGRAARVIIGLGMLYFVLSFISEFRDGLMVHQNRIETGGGIKDGIFLRLLSGLWEPFAASVDARFLGAGLGMGTNGATGYLTGSVTFPLGEGDWGRTIREMGPILGFMHIGLRIALVCYLARRAYQSLEHSNPLPTLLFSAVGLDLLNAQFGVPSILGLIVFKSALCLAATRLDTEAAPLGVGENGPQPELPQPFGRGFRGRSVYAEQLHGEAEDPVTQRFGP